MHLDYIRHPDAILPSGLWSKYGIVAGQGVSAVRLRLHGLQPPAIQGDARDRSDRADGPGVERASGCSTASTRVVDLVNDYLVPAAHAGGKKITAAVFPGPSRARTMVRQDWGRFKLDAFLPMLYHTFYEAGPEFVKQYTEEAVRTVKLPVLQRTVRRPARRCSVHDDRSRWPSRGGAAGVSIFDSGAMTAERWHAS